MSYDHGKHGWRKDKNQHSALFKKRSSKNLNEHRVDKDGLTWEQRQKVEKMKERQTYKESSKDPFE